MLGYDQSIKVRIFWLWVKIFELENIFTWFLATGILSAAFGGITIAIDQSIGAIAVGSFNILAMIIQGFLFNL